ncbi:putative fidgetin-like protein 2 [Nothoprocta perdicaria]|uniref:putative fidgetin-like protein 2 n=1 Tax=Nothoprocta perdicaria TaxID=30464 RepID=UPI000E1BA6FB|nr:putative fidgetin-like protein 2 [Nothoprocta perdicaria]
MHWSPEHAQSLNQWPEQHLDVSSTTSSPAHKPDLYAGGRQRFNYAWANDDISALTASNLLKRYAEKYAGVLDSPYERPVLGAYGDAAAFATLNGQKGDGEPWAGPPGPDGAYGLSPGHEGLGGAKAASGGPAAPATLPEPVYAGSSCSAQDYGSGYGGAYLSAGYCGQAASLPPGHPPGLLPPASALVPGYGGGGGGGPAYGYGAGYTGQAAYGGVHPAASYLPPAIAAPTPLPRPPAATYGSYQSPGLAPPPAPPDASLKRKAFDMVDEEEAEEAEEEAGGEGRYGKYGYEPPKPSPASPYGHNGFAEAAPFKAGKRPAAEEPPRGGKFAASKAFGGEAATRADPLALELSDGGKMVLEGGPPVQWADVAGPLSLKAAIEEELVWPMLRPGAYGGAGRPPRTVLLFGPRGGGKTLLSRCISTQLGGRLLRLSGAALLSTWKAEAETVLRAVFVAASCRQPAVVLISEADALLAAPDGGRLKSQLLSYLDEAAASAGERRVLVIGSTRRPGALDEAARRRFARRFYLPPPDGAARRHILQQALARQGCGLGERQLAALVQRTEGFSGGELLQLCQQAGAAALRGPPRAASFEDLESALGKVRPAASASELDLLAEWDKLYGSRH